MSTTVWMAIGVAVVVVFWAAAVHNRLRQLRNRVDNAFAQIDVQLKRRHDLIPNLVEVARGYMAHESSTLEAVARARGQAAQAAAHARRHPGQAAAMAIGQEVFLVSPIQAAGTLMELLPQADFWQRVGFSAGHILLGFALGVVVSVLLAAAAERWAWVDTLLAPVIQLVKATPVASFIILALVWVRGASLSVLISFLMVLPVLYGAVRTGIQSADPQLLEMTKVFRLPLGRRLRAVWLPAVLPAFRQGCSVALGICWKSGVAAEVIGLPDGSIGDALYRAKITLSTGELFAWTFVIILLSAGFEKLFLALLDKAVARVLGEDVTKND